MGVVDREFDSLTGLVTDIGFEEGKMHVRYSQDADPLHEQNMKLRQSDEFTKVGIKKDLVKVASLSATDCMKLLLEGIDPYTAEPREILNHLNRNRDRWGHLFTTRGNF